MCCSKQAPHLRQSRMKEWLCRKLHRRFAMSIMPSVLHLVQQEGLASSAKPKEGRALPQLHLGFLMSTMPSSLHLLQHAGLASPTIPNTGHPVPHRHLGPLSLSIPLSCTDHSRRAAHPVAIQQSALYVRKGKAAPCSHRCLALRLANCR